MIQALIATEFTAIGAISQGNALRCVVEHVLSLGCPREQREADVCRSFGEFQQLEMNNSERNVNMLYYALVFLIVAIVAGLLGFWAIAGVAATVAKILFILFIVLFLISLVAHSRRLP